MHTILMDLFIQERCFLMSGDDHHRQIFTCFSLSVRTLTHAKRALYFYTAYIVYLLAVAGILKFPRCLMEVERSEV